MSGALGTLLSEDASEQEAEEENLHTLRRSLSLDDDKKERRYIVDTAWFHAAVIGIIVLNTLQLGFEADYPELSTLWLVCENLFVAAFVIEMIAKLAVLRWTYFHDKANWLDAILTLCGALDCWIFTFVPGSHQGILQSMSILRVLRLARLARVLSFALKVKQFALVLSGVYQAAKLSLWVFMFLVLAMYVCAIFCTEYIGRGQEDLYPGYSTEEVFIDDTDMMQEFNPYTQFGSMIKSMLTLFNIAIGGEWIEVVRPLAIKQPGFVIMFVVYAMLIAFGVMNVMVGIVVDAVMEESKRLDRELEKKHMEKKRQLLERIQMLLAKLDSNKDGCVDLDELKNNFEALELQNLLEKCDLPAAWSANELLAMLDNNGDGVLEKAEFTTNFFRLMNSDDFQQMCMTQASINQVKHLVRQEHQKLELHMAEVRESLQLIRSSQLSGASLDSCKSTVAMKADTELDVDEMHDLREFEDSFCSVAWHEQVEDLNRLRAQTDQPALPGQGQKIAIPELHMKKQEKADAVPHNHGMRSGSDCGAAPCALRIAAQVDSNGHGLHHDFKSLPYKQFTDALDAALASVKETLCREFIVLTHGKDMSAISNGIIALATQDSCSKVDPISPDSRTGEGISTADHSCAPSAECSSPTDQSSPYKFASLRELAAAGLGTPSKTQPHPQELAQPTCHAGPDGSMAAGEDFVSLAGDASHEGLDDVICNRELLSRDPSSDPYSCDDITFKDGEKLGIEIRFQCPEALPFVGLVAPGGASYNRGVMQGDRVAECNGVSILGKSRDEVLLLLSQRPLVVRFQCRGR